MSAPLLLVHGWGFEAGFWDTVGALLPNRTIFRAEAGYLGADPDWPAVPPGTIAVGHSAGVLALLQRWPPGCAGLVSINGFSRFAAAADFPGVPERVVGRMAREFDGAPNATLDAFRARCGARAVTSVMVPDRLASGLRVLRDADGRETAAALFGAASGAPAFLLALASQDDPIVLPAHSRACFAPENLRWSQAGGHLLPLTRPDWCASMIEAVPC